MLLGKSKRPRNVDWPRAAAILYDDWETSKAYVIGLAFAVTGYSSFWLIVAGLGLFCLLHLDQALHNLKPLSGTFQDNWKGFVGIVLALSGVEAVAHL